MWPYITAFQVGWSHIALNSELALHTLNTNLPFNSLDSPIPASSEGSEKDHKENQWLKVMSIGGIFHFLATYFELLPAQPQTPQV